MSATRELLEARLERDQQEFVASLVSLRERVRADLAHLDPRRRIEERPAPWLIGAVLLGLWLGARR
ncbi:MAG TPA: hypothetical protein VMS55_01635 [Myxococcota bacterium]|nr:hypothetical protein [Myxococcota bacterium]